MAALQHDVVYAARICPVFRTITGNPLPDRLRVIGRPEMPAFDTAPSPEFRVEQIVLSGLPPRR